MRPYPQPEPVRRVVILQKWCKLTFLHWRYPRSTIAAHVPAPLSVELFDGSAWLGITPFMLKGLCLPSFPLTVRFRLYSFIRGKRGTRSLAALCGACLYSEQTLTTTAGIPFPVGDPIARFSPGVTVHVGPPQTL
jgi:uncharacterized protein YqjF (DUF2071 family)